MSVSQRLLLTGMSNKTQVRRQRGTGLVERVARMLRAEVRSALEPGQKLPTIDRLCAQFGVSVNTMLAAQGILAKEGLVERRHGHGVIVLPRARLRVVGVASEMDLLYPRCSTYVRDLTWTLRDRFVGLGFRVDLYLGSTIPGDTPVQPTCPRLYDDLKAGRLDALAIVNAPPLEPWLTPLKELTLPLVRTDQDVRIAGGEGIIELGLRQLKAQGCRRVAMLGWGGEPLRDRYYSVAAELGMEIREHWMRLGFYPWMDAVGWEEFREVWTAYPDKPDGLLIGDDGLFAEAMLAITELGIRVPEELRVVSHANKGSGIRSPFPVTLLQNDPVLVADALAAQLFRLMDGKPRSEPQFVPLEVVQIDRSALFAWTDSAASLHSETTPIRNER